MSLDRHVPVTDGITMENGGKLIISIDTKTKFQNLEVLDLSVNDNIILTSPYLGKKKAMKSALSPKILTCA